MKILKIILVSLVVIVALTVLVAFLMPSQMTTEQSITINSKTNIVFAHVNNLRNWNYWAKWNMIDPEMEVIYGDKWKGKDGSYEWSSEDPMVGAGTMTIKESIPNELIKTRIDFRDWDGANAEMRFEDQGDAVKISWSFDGDDVGMNIIGRLFNGLMKGSLEADLVEGLENLKALSEAQSMAMEIEVMPEMTVAYIPVETTSEQITPTLASSYGSILQHIAAQGATMTMMPMAYYADYRDEKVIMEPMAAIDKVIEEGETVKVKSVPQQTVAVFYHFGNYTGLSAAHDEAVAVLQSLGIEAGVASLEIYETDPGQEPDPDKWLTKICFKMN